MTETAAQKAERLMQQVSDASKSHYTPGEVRHILNNIATTTDLHYAGEEVVAVKRGDTFIAKVTGGKYRPWVVLSVRDEIVCAVAMSSGDRAPRMLKSQCRLWPRAWIGTTVSLFDHDLARKAVSRPYTNAKHLREVEAHVAGLMGLRTLRRAGRRRPKPGTLRAVA